MEVLVKVASDRRQTLWLMVREPVDLGRECDGLIIDDPKVSRRHVVLSVNDAGLVVTDLDSTNGTFVNGHRIAGAVQIGPGDEIRLGDTAVTVDMPVPAIPALGPGTRPGAGRGTVVADISAGGAAAFDTPATPALAPVRPAAAAAGARRTSIDLVAEAVQQAPVEEFRDLAGDEGTVTIVFSDIESSTEMAARVGDIRWLDILRVHNELIRAEVTRHGGTEIKSQGDGFMLSFPSARRAVLCMMRVQQAITDHATSNPDTGVRIRIGLHTGEVIKTDDGDLFGRHVIMAARIAGLANGGQILVSSLVRQITLGGGDLPYGEPVGMQLKGLGDEDYDLHEVRWWDWDQTQ